jgi:hypothetical protein
VFLLWFNWCKRWSKGETERSIGSKSSLVVKWTSWPVVAALARPLISWLPEEIVTDFRK